MDKVLFFDLSQRISQRRDEYSAALLRILDSGHFVLGEEVEKFELEFASYLGGGYPVGVANGSDGLEIAIAALSLESGSLIGTVANAGGYSSIGIIKNRMIPHYMDVNVETRNVEISEVERALNLGVKAIVVTHLYGNVIKDIEEIVKLCRDRGVYVVEDSSQAHGAKLKDSYAGRFGDISVFSLYPTKNLGAFGDAGIILVNNPIYQERIKQLRTYGWSEKYNISTPGGRNSRLDDLQAGILSINLKYLDEDNSSRIKIARDFLTRIKNPSIILPKESHESHVFHLFTILAENRTRLINHLKLNGINSVIHFPIPDYRQSGLSTSHLSLKNTEHLCANILSLPCYPDLDTQSQIKITNVLNDFS
jgi:dTDP-4-amino-4,6-dideoxygalactose transaminase